MAKNIDIYDIGEYFRGVVERAEHHAKPTTNTVYFLLGAVLQFSKGNIIVRTYKGETTNVVWFYVNERRYCLVYNHDKKQIELRNNSHIGECLYEYDDSVSLDYIRKSFTLIQNMS